jgi:hypothetical protein
MAKTMKERIPAAITGGILAAFTVFLSVSGVLSAPYAWNFGAWAIFITWAGYFAAGGGGPGKSKSTFKKIYPCIIWGSFWGFIAGVAFTYVNPTFGSDTTSLLIFDFVVIFLVNQPILWGSKYIKTLAYTPAHFYGFATFFATYFGAFGLMPGFGGTEVLVAWLSGLFMNLLGPIWGYMQVYFTFSKEVEAPEEPAKTKAS